ncbi:MAG: D-glycero-beta-D-manno-heptose-7-phosphate kinase [Planctomycetaceae bacterium]|nr:D-glycero-beta-D-manno-heptose-7-phosphate kinase [Planctomycetaceae bacterium]
MNRRELIEHLDALGRPRVLIVGDLIVDRYVSGDVSRISPEAPIPILLAASQEERIGGAGNVAANLRAMEASVEIVGVLGEDSSADGMLALLGGIGVETGGCVRDGGRPTTLKLRLVSGVQQMLRVDWEEARPLPAQVEARLLQGLEARVAAADAVVLSDYGKGVLTTKVLRTVIDAARAANKPVLVDPKGRDFSRYKGATLLTPNRREAEEALGRKLDSLEALPEAALELKRTADLAMSVITLGADGIFFLGKGGQSGRVPTVARAVFDVTGAGDTVIAQLALALGAGLDLETAVHLANHGAGIVVGRRGAASVTRQELRAALGSGDPQLGKVLRPEDVESAVALWRSEGKRIVFTNGCFDVLHAGHTRYLGFARSRGDALIVGVNDDASVKRLKGPTRPVNGLEDRMEVLAALEMVDAVVPFGDDTPAALIERITPHILVKGEDWKDKGVVGREWVERHGGEVILAPLLVGRSTSAILERSRGAKT